MSDPLMQRELLHAELDMNGAAAFTDVVPAPGAGKRILVHQIEWANDLNTGAYVCRVRFDTADATGKLPYRTQSAQRSVSMLPAGGTFIRCGVNEPVQARVVEGGDPAANLLFCTVFYTVEG